MPATQKQLDANRRNAQKSTGPKTPEGKARASLNAWRHGLTGQVATLPEEDRDAFQKFTRDIRLAYHPEGALETQIAQAIAEDEWRLSRARAIENNVLALGHSTPDADVIAENTQIHAAFTQARTFWRNPEKFALLSIYEQRISRTIQRNEARLYALQAERKAALEQALEEARLLAELAESQSEPHETTLPNGFAFSLPDFLQKLDRHRRLHRARNPEPPLKSRGQAAPPLQRAA